MKYIENHILAVEKIFDLYSGSEPLHLYLKKYFSKHKKFGSKDRRSITEYIYGVFRMGRENRHLTIRERVYLYLFLKGDTPKEVFEESFPLLAKNNDQPLNEKWLLCQENFELRDTYKFQHEVSDRIDNWAYRLSFFVEPRVFVRIRNNAAAQYEEIINLNGGEFLSIDTVSFQQRTRLEDIFKESDYVVQDFNSQQTITLLPGLSKDEWVWDCCAGSGGKSILLLDKFPEINLVATDIRSAILRNLIQRFEVYDLQAEMIAEVNVNKAKELEVLDELSFDTILCDVPCSGSGTWSRTPEQLYYFDKKEIAKYQSRQLDILKNVSARVKSKGYVLYITCSIFARENEFVVSEFLGSNEQFELIKDDYLDGTNMHADTLYAALLQKR